MLQEQAHPLSRPEISNSDRQPTALNNAPATSASYDSAQPSDLQPRKISQNAAPGQGSADQEPPNLKSRNHRSWQLPGLGALKLLKPLSKPQKVPLLAPKEPVILPKQSLKATSARTIQDICEKYARYVLDMERKMQDCINIKHGEEMCKIYARYMQDICKVYARYQKNRFAQLCTEPHILALHSKS